MEWITKILPTASLITQQVALIYIISIIWAFSKARFYWKKSSIFNHITISFRICLFVNAILVSFLVVSSKIGIYWAVGISLFGIFPIIPAALIISVIDSLSAGLYILVCVFVGYTIKFMKIYYDNWCGKRGLYDE
jgi:hypothetical protein